MDKELLWKNLMDHPSGLWRSKLNFYIEQGMLEAVCKRLYSENFRADVTMGHYFRIWEKHYNENKSSYIPDDLGSFKAEAKKQADSIRKEKGITLVDQVKETFKDIPAKVIEDEKGVSLISGKEAKLDLNKLSKEELLILLKASIS